MDRTLIGLIGVGVALVLIFLRVPIGVAMGIVGFGGIATLISWHAAIGIAKAIPYQLIGDWNLSAVPMFLLMGYVASATGLTSGLFASGRIFSAGVPGRSPPPPCWLARSSLPLRDRAWPLRRRFRAFQSRKC